MKVGSYLPTIIITLLKCWILSKLNSTITKDAGIHAKININIPNKKNINTKTDIPPINQSKISIDESKIVSSNNNNHVTTILNAVTLNSTITKDADIHAEININIPNKKTIQVGSPDVRLNGWVICWNIYLP